MFYSTKLDRITHLSCNDVMMKRNSIIPLYMFSSLTHLALDHCSHIGPSLASYKSPILSDLRIRSSDLDSTKFEVLEKIRRLIRSYKGLDLLALHHSSLRLVECTLGNLQQPCRHVERLGAQRALLGRRKASNACSDV